MGEELVKSQGEKMAGNGGRIQELDSFVISVKVIDRLPPPTTFD
jgi:hypothetical protein